MHEQVKLLKSAEVREELKLSPMKTCVELSLLQFNEVESQKDEIAEGKQSSLRGGMPTVRVSSAKECTEMLTLFRNVVARQLLREPMGYGSKKKAGNYMDGTIMSTAMLDAWVAAEVNCSLGRESLKDVNKTSMVTSRRE